MKEKREENDDNNNDEDNEKLSPMKFESFNISLPENENEVLTQKKTKTGIVYLLILIIFIIIITLLKNGKENICQKGYFIPEDSKDNKCIKCSVENCDECHGKILSNICISCKPYLTPILEMDKIKYCKYTCETGINEKCKKCDEIKNECSSCNTGFKLEKGKCIINYSFRATYFSEYKKQKAADSILK